MKSLEEMRMKLIAKAEDDLEFRNRLAKEPRAVIEEEFGIKVPKDMDLYVHEDSHEALHLVLPPEPELKIDDMSAATGGRNQAGQSGSGGPSGWDDKAAQLCQ